MSIFLNKNQRGNPSDKTAPKLWRFILKSTGLVRKKTVAKSLADETTLNPKEAETAIAQLIKVVFKINLNYNEFKKNVVIINFLFDFRLKREYLKLIFL